MDTVFSAFADPAATSQVFTALLSILTKGAFILAVTGLIVHFLQSSAATLRHLIWMCGLSAVLVLPVVSVVLPGVVVPVIPDHIAQRLDSGLRATPSESFSLTPSKDLAKSDFNGFFGRGAESGVASDATLAGGEGLESGVETEAIGVSPIRSIVGNLLSLSWMAWALLAWLMGSVILLGRLSIAHLSVLGLVRRADRVDDDDWQLDLEQCSNRLGIRGHVRLRQSDWLSVPVSVGLRRPTIVLPAHAHEWTDETRRTVLLHELAHVRRRDCLLQLFVEVTRALHWVNPMVWVAAFHIKQERERACDDAVLVSGTAPSSYAKALLDIARSINDRELSGAAVMAMARKSELEGRLLDILNATPRLRTVNRATAILSAFVIISFALPVSILQLAIAAGPSDHLSFASAQGLEPGDEETEVVAAEPYLIFRSETAGSTGPAARIHDDESVVVVSKGAQSYSVSRQAGGRHGVVIARGSSRLAPQPSSHARASVGDEVDAAIAELSSRIKGLEAALASPVFRSTSGEHALSWITDSLSEERVLELKHSALNGDYVLKMKVAGFDSSRIQDYELLVRSGVDSDLISSLKRRGFSFSARDVVSLSDNGVDSDLVDAVGKVGLRFTANDFVVVASQGVDEDLVLAACRNGFKFTASELAKLAASGVDEDYLGSLRTSGLRFSADEISRLAMNGVDEDLFAILGRAGVVKVSADEIVNLSNHGYSEECLSDLLSVTGKRFALADIDRLYQSGVDASFLRRMSARGMLDIGVDRLIDLSQAM